MTSFCRLESSSNSHVREVNMGECIMGLKKIKPEFYLKMESLEAKILLATELIKL